MSSIGTNQHYVPQLLLKGFCERNSKRVWVFEKESSRVFASNIRNVAAERGFYDFEVGDEIVSFDHSLTTLEEDAADVLYRIRSVGSINLLSHRDRVVLASFVAAQYVRTNANRKQYRSLTEHMHASLNALNATEELHASFSPLTEEEAKRESILMLPSMTASLAPLVLQKQLILNVAAAKSPLMIGDAPVVMHNSLAPKAFGISNVGFAVPGVEIYLPISQRYCLMFLCPSIEASLKADGRFPDGGAVKDSEKLLKRLSEAMFHLEVDNVQHINSLQIANAERFVFGHTNDFSLAERMIDSSPSLKSGLRFGPLR